MKHQLLTSTTTTTDVITLNCCVCLLILLVILVVPFVNAAAADGRGWWKPKPLTTWQWQLSGTIDTSYRVDMYDIDLDTPQNIIDTLRTRGVKVICYFSAGSFEKGRSDAKQFPSRLLGKVLDGWPDERWLDIRDGGALKAIMRARLDKAVAKKCDGVEPDNVDGYANDSGFKLMNATAQLTYNKWLAQEAHARNLSVGLKNDIDQIKELVNDFDWALNEQCFQYDECGEYARFIAANKAVFGCEYAKSQSCSTFCPKANKLRLSFLKKRLALDSLRADCQNQTTWRNFK